MVFLIIKMIRLSGTAPTEYEVHSKLLYFGRVMKIMWPAFTQRIWDMACWSKKLPTPGLSPSTFSMINLIDLKKTNLYLIF
jgi:hypothetical protein